MKEIIKFGLIATVLAAFAFAGCKNDDDEIINNNGNNKHKVDSVNYVIEQLNKCFPDSIFEDISPADQSTSVDVFDRPQVVFNVPINTEKIYYIMSFRVSIVEFSVAKADGTKVDGDYTLSDDNRTCVFNIKEPYESGASYKIYIKVRYEQKSDSVWQIVKDNDGNEYIKERTTEFTVGNRPLSFNPKHILHAYPADRQYAFLPKEYQTAYMILDFDYSYLLNQYKEKGYEQKIRITPFGGETTTVDFTYTTATNGCGSAEIDYSIADLRLDTNVIYHLAIVNIAKDSSHTDAIVPYEIYTIDFRTSYYNTITEKMDNTAIGNIVAWQIRPYVYNLKCNWKIGGKTETFKEPFDDYDYNKDEPSRSLIHVNLDYDNCEWYKEKMAPLIYENADVLSIVGNYTPPVDVHYIYGAQNKLLTDEEVETGKLEERNGLMNLNWYGLEAMDNDLFNIHTILANYGAKNSVSDNVRRCMQQSNIPSLTTGKYPMKLEYVLPGKKIVTTTLIVDMEYK